MKIKYFLTVEMLLKKISSRKGEEKGKEKTSNSYII